MKPYKTGLFSLVLAGLYMVFSFHPQLVSAQGRSASIFLSPSIGTFTVDSTFTVSILLNTSGNFVNAIEANLTFPPDKLQVVSPTTGKSMIQVWTAQPTFSNSAGTMKFQGAVPSPGISTESGLISTVTFRVKNTGTAIVKIADSSQVLLNDGRGTDVLGQTTDGLYYLTLPPPAGPIVTSGTHPDQEHWYPAKNAVFRWEGSPDSDGFSYVLNDLPVDEPDDISEGNRTGVSYRDLADGIYYFHIKRLRSGVWGGITNYKIQIDATPPAEFSIEVSPSTYTSQRRPIVDFKTTDSMSGVDHYEMKFISLDAARASANASQEENTPFFIEVTAPYSQALDIGRYDVLVKAFDRAGNFSQSTERLTIVHQIFEIIRGEGVRIGGVYTVRWPYVGIFSTVILLLVAYFARKLWKWHREIEEKLQAGPHSHPVIAGKLAELKQKQSEYGGIKSGMPLAILLLCAIGFSLLFHTARAQGTTLRETSVPIEPPVITLFPKSLSNDEIFYIGGNAGAPDAQVLIYIQDEERGNTFSHSVVTDKNGSWFYSLPQFLNTGHYLVWTQLKVVEELSPPSSRIDLTVGPTAIQFGKDRLSYQDFYLILVFILVALFIGLLGFIVYHWYHVRSKRRRFLEQVKQAEESIQRGFLVLRRDIEQELNLIQKTKFGKGLSDEERFREEKLLKDFETISNYVGKEIWELEKSEQGMS